MGRLSRPIKCVDYRAHAPCYSRSVVADLCADIDIIHAVNQPHARYCGVRAPEARIRYSALQLRSPNARERIAAGLIKKPPCWSGC